MRLLKNLMDNAIEKEGTENIFLRLYRENSAVIEVIDDGPEMDGETKQKLFDAFFTTKKKGTGLGLASVKRIVHHHGGEYKVESTVEKTSFRIYLPLAK